MPFELDETMWSSVLNSCRIHKNEELAKKAAQQLFNMAKLRDGASYITMSKYTCSVRPLGKYWESTEGHEG